VIIRATTVADIPELPDIERSAGRAFLQIPEFAWVASDSVIETEEHARFVDSSLSWVVQSGADLCGFLCAHLFDRTLHVAELAVHLSSQGQGMGAALLRHVIHEAREHRNCTEVTLTTFRDVAFNAPFYARLGFAELRQGSDGGVEDARLAEMLALEVAHGFPAESRCAMRLLL